MNDLVLVKESESKWSAEVESWHGIKKCMHECWRKKSAKLACNQKLSGKNAQKNTITVGARLTGLANGHVGFTERKFHRIHFSTQAV